MKFIAYILLASFSFMHSRCLLGNAACVSEPEQTEMVCGETSCCQKKSKCHTTSEKEEGCPEKKECGDEKGCDPSTCCICCFALTVEPAKFIDAGYVEKNEPLPGYLNNFNSTYVSSSWNPPEMV